MPARSLKKLPGDSLGRLLFRLIHWSSNHPRAILLSYIIITIPMILALRNLTIDVGIADYSPQDNPNVVASERFISQLGNSSNLEVIYFQLDSGKAQKQGIDNITDELSVRAMFALFTHIQGRVPQVKDDVGLPRVVKTMNYLLHNNDLQYYDIPEGSQDFATCWALARIGSTPQINLALGGNLDYQGAMMPLLIDAEPLSEDARRIGLEIERAILSYEPEERYDLFMSKYLINNGLNSGLARFEIWIQRDSWLAIPAFIFILICLFLAFRSVKLVMIAILSLFIGFIWTLGILPLIGVTITTSSLLAIPIVLGVGIDYSIHVINEYLEEKGKGANDKEAFRRLGGRAGVAICMAAIGTIVGLSAISLSNSRALIFIAITGAIAMALIPLIALTFVPALITLTGGINARAFAPSRAMEKASVAIGKNPVYTIVALVAVSAVLIPNIINVEYYAEITTGNLPKGDPAREAYIHLSERRVGGADEMIILEGDIADPATLNYILTIERNLVNASDLVESMGNINSITWILGSYNSLRKGSAGSLESLGALVSGKGMRALLPETREEVNALIDEMREDEIWRYLIDLVLTPDKNMTVIQAFVKVENDYDSLRYVWDRLWECIDAAEDRKPEGVNVYVQGISTGYYLFLTYSGFWLEVLFLVTIASSAIIMFLTTRKLKAILAVIIPEILATLWWLGILPYFDLRISLTMILPIVFITSIGADYTCHLTWNILKTGSVKYAFSSTGKAVMFSALTSFGAFLFFGFSHIDEFVATPMVATSIALAIMFATTLLVVPVIFSSELSQDSDGRE